MADGIFPSLVSKSRDVNAVGNPIWVELTDGTAAVGVTGGALDVNVANSSIAVTGTFYRDLVAGVGSGEDNVLIFANTNKDGSGTDYVPLVDSDGQLQVDVLTMPAVAFNAEYLVDDSAGATDYGMNVLVVRDDALTTLTPVDGDYVSLRVNSTGALWVKDDALTLADDAVKISGNSNANTETNPIFVKNVDTVISGEEVHNYDTSVNVAVDTADNHDYAVAGTVFLLKSVIVSASGNVKFEVQVGPVASLATVAVGFLNGRQGDTQQLFFDPPIEVPSTSTGTVRIARTNRQGATMDVYSTIIGYDV